MEFLHGILMLLMTIISFLIFLSSSPVYSVLLLILEFCLASIVLLLFGVEFIGLLFIMVYVGAVAVLFLFVIMMIDTKKIIVKKVSNIRYLILSILVSGIFININFKLNDIFFNISNDNVIIDKFNSSILITDNLSNLELIGQSLYNNYNTAFLIAGLVLLVALVGCISLTIELKKNNEEGNTEKQISKTTSSTNKFN